jgi:carboxyl-terminal processing protease
MKPLHRSIAAFTALGFALIASVPAIALRSGSRLDAPTPDGKITQLTAQLLEQAQFAHRHLDDPMAAKFQNRYLDSLDGAHELFLQSDITEFLGFLPHLADATRSAGDTRPARVIFDRYLQRIDERAAFVKKVLAEDKFDFTGHDRYSYDRENAPRPRDLAEAHQLWLQRLRADVLQEELAGKKPEQFAATLAQRYARQAQTMKKLSADAVLEIYLNALAHIYDPHSDYMGREQLQSFNIVMNLSLAGIGATLQSDDDYCKIRELVPGGPAARSGKLKIGDRIVAVSQGPEKEAIDLFDLPLPQAVDLIRGPKGSDVRLTIIPAGENGGARKTVTIQRDVIHLEEQKAKARIVDFKAGSGKTARLGVIDLPSFYASDKGEGESATADVASLIRKLQREDVGGLILDLRRNGGGSLDEAINLAGLFLPSGPVVQTRDLAGHIEVCNDKGGPLYTGPLIVLTSRFSASASEIVAGALQDYGRALIVGDFSTFGKGTVQTILPLGPIMERSGVTPASDPGALKVTISKFYRPGGSSTQLRGVRPDIVLPSLTDTPEISEAGMKNPMEWDAVPPAHFTHFDLVAPFVTTLRDQSRARIDSDRDFKWWREDVASLEQNRASKSVSLNEADRLRERDNAKARTKAHDAERLAHKEAIPPTYEITVKNAAEPGLPKPIAPEKSTVTSAQSNDDSGDDADSALPSLDLLLRETENILTDYMQFLAPASNPSLTLR